MLSMHAPLSAVDAVTRLGGVARVRRVLELTSRSRLRTGLRRGELIKLSHGRVALPVADRALDQAAMVGGVVSHLSAALHHGWQVKEVPEVPTVTVPPGWDRRTAPELFLADTCERRLPPGERDGWATTPLRTVLDCARDLPFEVALCVADSALRNGDVTAEQLVGAAGGPRERRVATYADGRAANPFESVLRALCILIGLDVLPQFAVTWGGVTYHPDLANPILGLALEADSYAFHGREPADHARDCARYNALVLAGWTVLRFTWEQVMLSPRHVEDTLRRWVASAQRPFGAFEGPRHAG